jgi:hypothetical protein
MNAQDVIVPFTALFIVGMIWLRTRMQYARPGAGPLHLTPAGRIYFAAAIALLLVGWFAAPILGRAFWPTTGATPTLMRVVWCLATYYIFILIHRVLKARGATVFKHLDLERVGDRA